MPRKDARSVDANYIGQANMQAPTAVGRSHATEHHYVAERLFGRSKNRRGTKREGIFAECPWGLEGKAEAYCYECREELLHNPVLLPDDVSGFARLVQFRDLAEDQKPEDRKKLAGRIMLMHEVISAGIRALLNEAGVPET